MSSTAIANPHTWADGSEEFGPRLVGVDPASPGGDHAAVCVGRYVCDRLHITYSGPDRRVEDLGCGPYGHDRRKA